MHHIVEDDYVLIHSFIHPSTPLPTTHAAPSPSPLLHLHLPLSHTQQPTPTSTPTLTTSKQQALELTWLLTTSLRGTLHQLRHGLEDSYALLAPVDSGSTLVLTTPRHETIKGHVTRVGTRLVRGAISLRLRTLPPLTLALVPGRPLRLAPLQALHGILTGAVDLLRELCDVVVVVAAVGPSSDSGEEMEKAPYIADRLKVLARQLAEASRIIKGSPLPMATPAASPPSASSSTPPSSSSHHSRPSTSSSAAPPPPSALRLTSGGTGWTTHSASLTHFSNSHTPSSSGHLGGAQQQQQQQQQPPPRNISMYLTIEDASLVLYVRSLEPAGAPMNLGAKLAFAIGTARRIEHDEAERVFRYACDDESKPGSDVDGNNNNSSNNFLGVGGGSFLGVGGSRPSSSSGGSSSNYKMSGGGGSSGGSVVRRSAEQQHEEHAVGGMVGIVHEGEQETEKEEKPKNNHVDVYVREKVRVESADPSLLSLSAKLLALSNTLALARRNLAAVMGEECED